MCILLALNYTILVEKETKEIQIWQSWN